MTKKHHDVAEPAVVFAARLKQAMAERGLSQAALAERAGLPRTGISHFLAARRAPSLGSLRALSDALGVDMDFLAGRRDEAMPAGPAFGRLLGAVQEMGAEDLDLLGAIAVLLADRRK